MRAAALLLLVPLTGCLDATTGNVANVPAPTASIPRETSARRVFSTGLTAPAADKKGGSAVRTTFARGRVELDHEPIASMSWPRMKMGFLVEDKASLGALKPGDSVEFELKGEPDKDGVYTIAKIRKAP